MPNHLSLQAAASLLACSKRTLWRRVSDGGLDRGPDDAHGRATIGLAAVQNHCDLPWAADDWQRVLAADHGDRTAQCETGLQLLLNQRPADALYWLQLAAQQGEPDALYWLGYCALRGWGQTANPHQGLQHLAHAAAAGHVIAQAALVQVDLSAVAARPSAARNDQGLKPPGR